MNLPNDPANPWSEGKIYKFGDVEIIVLKAQPYEPVRYYTEIHRYGAYVASYGSNALFRLAAVYAALWHECPKEEQGYRCRHGITRNGTVECGSMGESDWEDDDDES